jgi:amino acid permease
MKRLSIVLAIVLAGPAFGDATCDTATELIDNYGDMIELVAALSESCQSNLTATCVELSAQIFEVIEGVSNKGLLFLHETRNQACTG